MKFVAKIVKTEDGEAVAAADKAAQVVVVSSSGEPIMAGFIGPESSIIASHIGDDGWLQFLADNVLDTAVPGGVSRSLGKRAHYIAKITPEIGAQIALPVEQLYLCSDFGDPVVVAGFTDGNRVTANVGDQDWSRVCKSLRIYSPRTPIGL